MATRIDLYFWHLTPDDRASALAVLSDDEVKRHAAFATPALQDAYLAGRSGMRRILSEVMSQPPKDLRFSYGPEGKPSLPDGPSFNLSHTGQLACLAVHPHRALGVDIETVRAVSSDLPGRFFSPNENAALEALAPHDWANGFFRCWTRKEAIIKAIGGGLSIPLDAFDVTLDADAARLTRLEPRFGDTGDWCLAPFDIGPDTLGAIAVQNGGGPVMIDVRACPDDLHVRVPTASAAA